MAFNSHDKIENLQIYSVSTQFFGWFASMFSGILVVFGLIYGTASGGLLQEDLPPQQLKQFLADVIFKAKGSIVSQISLSNINLQFNEVFAGIPLELALVTRNTTLLGPTSLEQIGEVVGQQEPSGSAMVRATLAVGNLEVRYPYLLIDFFGYKYEGSAQMTIIDAKQDVEIHIYRNVLTSCQVTTSVSKPVGILLLTFGEEGTWLRFITSVVEYFLSRTVVPDWLVEWAFFPDVVSHLHEIIGRAAKSIACN